MKYEEIGSATPEAYEEKRKISPIKIILILLLFAAMAVLGYKIGTAKNKNQNPTVQGSSVSLSQTEIVTSAATQKSTSEEASDQKTKTVTVKTEVVESETYPSDPVGYFRDKNISEYEAVAVSGENDIALMREPGANEPIGFLKDGAQVVVYGEIDGFAFVRHNDKEVASYTEGWVSTGNIKAY